ncbi:MAG TPA: hypothetical protein VEX36_08480 [Thermoleophilaceae bacterium]|nr:hypothetical protein [Thermoleophilaceae bacterium]
MAVVAGRGVPATADDGGPWLIGKVDRVDSEHTFHVTRVRGDSVPVRVDLTAGATVVRDGPASLTDFQVGDEVGAAGEWNQDGSYSAYTVESTYRLLDAEVQAVDGETLATAAGGVLLSDETRARTGLGPNGQEIEATPVADIEAGEHVVVLGRRNAATDGPLEAVVVGTYE